MHSKHAHTAAAAALATCCVLILVTRAQADMPLQGRYGSVLRQVIPTSPLPRPLLLHYASLSYSDAEDLLFLSRWAVSDLSLSGKLTLSVISISERLFSLPPLHTSRKLRDSVKIIGSPSRAARLEIQTSP